MYAETSQRESPIADDLQLSLTEKASGRSYEIGVIVLYKLAKCQGVRQRHLDCAAPGTCNSFF